MHRCPPVPEIKTDEKEEADWLVRFVTLFHRSDILTRFKCLILVAESL